MTPVQPSEHERREADLELLSLLVRQGCHKINNRIMEVESQLALAETELREPEAMGGRIKSGREALRALAAEVAMIHAQARGSDGEVDHFALSDLLEKLRPYLHSPSMDRPSWQIAEGEAWSAFAAGDASLWHRAILLLMEGFLRAFEKGGPPPRLSASEDGGRLKVRFESRVNRDGLESSALFKVGAWQAYELGFECHLSEDEAAGVVVLDLLLPGAL